MTTATAQPTRSSAISAIVAETLEIELLALRTLRKILETPTHKPNHLLAAAQSVLRHIDKIRRTVPLTEAAGSGGPLQPEAHATIAPLQPRATSRPSREDSPPAPVSRHTPSRLVTQARTLAAAAGAAPA